MWQQLLKLQNNKTVKYGVPMLVLEKIQPNEESHLRMCIPSPPRLPDIPLLVVGGSFGLREFTQIRYDAQRIKKKMDPALEARVSNNKLSLEEEYQKLQQVDLDSWNNVRGPRPWENSRQNQEQPGAQLGKGA